MVEIKAKQRLYSAELLPEVDTQDLTSKWNETFLDKQTYQNYKNCATDKVLTVNGNDIYLVKEGNYYVYYSLDFTEPYLNFYSKVGIVKDRRKLFISGAGRYQSAVWRRLDWRNRGENFVPKFLYALSQSNNIKVLVTDMLQTKYGMDMWIKFLSYALSKGLDCYYGLSSPSDRKCVIKIETQHDIFSFYNRKIVHQGPAYSYRCAFVLHKGQSLDQIIFPEIPVLTVKEALEKNLFRRPRRLREHEIEQRNSEYDK